MAMDWFRSWHNAPTDPKWLIVARKAKTPPGMVSAVFWALLDHASQEKDRGSVVGFDVETYAGWSGWDEDEIQSIIDAMRAKGVITEDNRLASWEKRQPKKEDPTGAERQARYRDAQRNADVTLNADSERDVTPSNAELRDVTLSNARSEEIREEENRLDKRVTQSNAELRDVTPNDPLTPTYPPGFEEFEKVFKMNLITEVTERDPRQSMMGGFSFDETSRALLLQVFNKGPILSSKAVTWGMDQWESAKKDQQFRVQERGCINWLLTTIFNSYKPTSKSSAKNGTDPVSPPEKVEYTAVYEDGITQKVLL